MVYGGRARIPRRLKGTIRNAIRPTLGLTEKREMKNEKKTKNVTFVFHWPREA